MSLINSKFKYWIRERKMNTIYVNKPHKLFVFCNFFVCWQVPLFYLANWFEAPYLHFLLTALPARIDEKVTWKVSLSELRKKFGFSLMIDRKIISLKSWYLSLMLDSCPPSLKWPLCWPLNSPLTWPLNCLLRSSLNWPLKWTRTFENKLLAAIQTGLNWREHCGQHANACNNWSYKATLILTSDLSVFRNSWTRSLSEITFTETTEMKQIFLMMESYI